MKSPKVEKKNFKIYIKKIFIDKFFGWKKKIFEINKIFEEITTGNFQQKTTTTFRV